MEELGYILQKLIIKVKDYFMQITHTPERMGTGLFPVTFCFCFCSDSAMSVQPIFLLTVVRIAFGPRDPSLFANEKT